ncbi:MAG: cation-translocating P-type ATPase [Planctomycetaceae bacterium]
MPSKFEIPTSPWSLTSEETLKALATNATSGLTSEEAARRKQELGANDIPEPPEEPFWKKYWGQLTGDAVVRLLLIGGVVSLLLGDFLEGGAIILMLNIMAGFGLWQEGKADDAAKSLRKSENPLTLLIRDGQRREVPVVDVVPGDIVYLPTGAIPPADGRVIAAVLAEEDDSMLTGEPPRPVRLEAVAAATVVNDQHNMVFRGCGIVSGNATAVITSTGVKTNVGQIAERLSEAEKAATPLDEQLESLGDSMASIFKWLAFVVIGVGLIREFAAKDLGSLDWTTWETWKTVIGILKAAFINAVALIIAAIPEGLPAVLTITLAIATQVMKKHQALVKRPKAVEGGGSMNLLCTDKTGTLTANRMSVEYLYLNGKIFGASEFNGSASRDPISERALRIAKLCNNNSSVTESALLQWISTSGFDATGDVGDRVTEHPFSQNLKRMTTIHQSPSDGRYHILTKGAPERLLELCHQVHVNGQDVRMGSSEKAAIETAIAELAGRGLRVIAVADRVAPNAQALERHEAEAELTFVGLFAIMDPPRVDVAPAVATLDKAGIRTVMVTGDNSLTAYHVAKMVGIVHEGDPLEKVVISGHELNQYMPTFPQGAKPKEKEELLEQALDKLPEAFVQRLRNVEVFARVEPAHKDFIVRALQRAGLIVGFVGDGVNDAIALRQSDVGFAMGNGTDVAREASDVILMDSRFGTIPNAVEEGRNVLHRIRLYLSYILSGNGCEVGVFVVAYALGWDIPLTALVLLVINFATDSFPALAMSFEAGEHNVMSKLPRKRDMPFINRVMWGHIWVQTLVATIVIMGVYYYALSQVPAYFSDRKSLSKEALAGLLETARSAAFMTYIWQKLFRGFTARSMTRSLFEIGPFRNHWSIGAVLLSLAISLFFVYVPGVNKAMGLAALDGTMMAITCLVGLIPPIVEEISKPFLRKMAD